MNAFTPVTRIAVPLEIDAAALRGGDPAAPICAISGQTMGTTWQVQTVLPDGTDRAEEQALQAEIQRLLDDLCSQMSHWDDQSELCRFNQAAAGSIVELSAAFADVIGCALEIARKSEGAFDPAMGRVTDVWGLGPHPASGPPQNTAIAQALRLSGWNRLGFDQQQAQLRQPGGAWLDLSGIAKGYAADAVADFLAERGIRHALVEIGGELVGRGRRPDGDPWWVDVENPPGMNLAGLRIALHQLAIATSGDYLRGAHTLDPRTGRPAVHDTTAVTVLHPRCMEADAWATALSVVEVADAQVLARRHDLAVRIVSRTGDEWLSPALEAML
ncbi:FAD:protein FMN transferase [Novosphingobium sp. 28-62-57]|uniref:FAD:protein FMN transferase n=1 Tax=unclassified Novosphingobium TaxID=2644732 RepID=UPI00345B7514